MRHHYIIECKDLIPVFFIQPDSKMVPQLGKPQFNEKDLLKFIQKGFLFKGVIKHVGS